MCVVSSCQEGFRGDRCQEREINGWEKTRPLLADGLNFTSSLSYLLFEQVYRDDTKATARQSLNCIKTKQIKYGEERFSIWRIEFIHPAMWHDHDVDFVR